MDDTVRIILVSLVTVSVLLIAVIVLSLEQPSFKEFKKYIEITRKKMKL